MSARAVFTDRFAGKVLVVTGAGQGIGAAVAARAAAEGGAVVLADRGEHVETVRRRISDGGGQAVAVLTDLSTYDGAVELAGKAVAEFGRVDVLINNVGGTIWRKPLEHYEPDEILAELQRSLLPTLWCCRAVLPAMVERGGGVIVNVSSNATRSVNRVPYAAAKGGINALTASLAFEAAPKGVRVCATAPGGVVASDQVVPRHPGDPTIAELAWHEETILQSTESTFLKRFSAVEEQVAPILFLASDEASYITGSVLPVAGGDVG